MKKEKIPVFAAIFLLTFLLWILLTGLSIEELIAGSIASIVVSAMSYRLFRWEKSYLIRSLWLLAYIPYYIYAEIRAHLEVIFLIFTGKIKPGIVEVENPHKSDFGTAILANSITMTPGTITLEISKGKLYIHMLNMKRDKENITSGFEKFLRRIWP